MSQTTYSTTVKSGRGARYGVVSELSAFLTIKPGEADALRAGLERFHAHVHTAPWDVIAKIGIVDMKHVIFDDDTRLCWNTAFDTDWDPYIDDAVAILGVGSWADWLQHTVGYETEDFSSSAAIKRYLQSAQCPATGFYRAIDDMTLSQTKRAQEVMAAFEEVLDTPGAAEALRDPVFKPLLDKAAG
jgi:hypothetical protein